MNDDPASGDPPTRAEAARAFLGLLREHDLPEPEEILDHEDGGILCLWHEQKLAVVIDVEQGR
jgi:hypothetical protein